MPVCLSRAGRARFEAWRRRSSASSAWLDVFEGGLKGLLVAEVEFENESENQEFEPPDWSARRSPGTIAIRVRASR